MQNTETDFFTRVYKLNFYKNLNFYKKDRRFSMITEALKCSYPTL